MTKNGNKSTLSVRGGDWANDRTFYARVSLEEIRFGPRIRGTDTGFRTSLSARQSR